MATLKPKIEPRYWLVRVVANADEPDVFKDHLTTVSKEAAVIYDGLVDNYLFSGAEIMILLLKLVPDRVGKTHGFWSWYDRQMCDFHYNDPKFAIRH